MGTFYLKQVYSSIAPSIPQPWHPATSSPSPCLLHSPHRLFPAHCLTALSPAHSRGQQKLGSQVPHHWAGPQTSTTQFALKGSAPGVCICGQSPQDALQPGSTPGTCQMTGVLAGSLAWPALGLRQRVQHSSGSALCKGGAEPGAGWVSEAGAATGKKSRKALVWEDCPPWGQGQRRKPQ